MVCSFPGCGREHAARGLCDGHYQQLKAGSELRRLRSDISPGERFASKVAPSKSGCWEWRGRLRKGYGGFSVDGRAMQAHRFAFMQRCGSIPPDRVVDHICRNRACVRPSHLRLATTKENAENRASNRGSSTGVRGVTIDRGKYRAQVMHNGVNHFGGCYPDLESASVAAQALRKRLFTHSTEE